MNLVDFYYYNIGEEPNDEDRSITKNTLNYLKDNNYSDNEIVDILKNIHGKMKLTHDDLPDSLWENSLIKRDTFYYHNKFHIVSPAPYWNPETNEVISCKFYLEMIIRFYVEDLIKYFYENFPLDISLINDKKDIGSMNYLLNKYKNIDFIEPIDFIMFLIDEAKDQNAYINNILDLSNYEKDTFMYLKNKTLNAKVEKKNLIVWR